MPKKPSVKKRVVKVVKRAVKRTLKKEEPKEEVKDAAEENLPVPEPVEEAPKPLPLYNGSQVTQILSSGHTKELYHCAAVQGENRITLHVPKNLF